MYKSEKFWDRFAGQKEEIPVDTVRKIKTYLDKSHKVLDFGCATGTISNEIAGDVKELLGIDISSKMVQAAQNNSDSRNISNTRFLQSSIFDEKLDSDTYDIILAFNILHLLDNAPEVMLRLYQLLKPGGIIISSSACLNEKKTMLASGLFLLSKIRLIPPINTFSSMELADLFTDSGFDIIESISEFQGKLSHLITARKD
jgi:2-polyprenyl-3-methyl-5-hydroxy-6-metoxy-1,4-benzoquinol methylase